jgi:CBS domain containing-hemolysin-like protein
MIQPKGEKVWLVNGRTLLEELEDEFGIRLDDEENDTIAGHVMMILGRTARVGDEVTVAGRFRVRVTAMRQHQITHLEFSELEPPGIPLESD